RLATKRRPAGRRPGADSAQYRQPGDGRKRHPLQDLSAKTSRYCPAAEPRAQVSAASYRNFIAAHVGATADGPKTKNDKLNCWPTPRSRRPCSASARPSPICRKWPRQPTVGHGYATIHRAVTEPALELTRSRLSSIKQFWDNRYETTPAALLLAAGHERQGHRA